jgi:hypothetical protein
MTPSPRVIDTARANTRASEIKKNNKKKIVLSEDTVICLELRSKRSSNNVSNLALEPRVKLEFVQK